MSGFDQIVIGTYPEAVAAHLARVRLEAEGIESWILDENMGSIYPLYTQMIGGVKLAVHERDAAAASGYIRDLEIDEHDASTEDAFQCPECSSKNVGRNPLGFTWLLVLSLLSFGLYLPLVYRRRQCEDCGCLW